MVYGDAGGAVGEDVEATVVVVVAENHPIVKGREAAGVFSRQGIAAAVIDAVVDEGEKTVAVLFKQNKVRVAVGVKVEGRATYRVDAATP